MFEFSKVLDFMKALASTADGDKQVAVLHHCAVSFDNDIEARKE